MVGLPTGHPPFDLKCWPASPFTSSVLVGLPPFTSSHSRPPPPAQVLAGLPPPYRSPSPFTSSVMVALLLLLHLKLWPASLPSTSSPYRSPSPSTSRALAALPLYLKSRSANLPPDRGHPRLDVK
ncbi:hypothetical protein CF326_g2201 [Tilletia indica]|nr:hypothetical protein CF326_g2201 [Tilletia indica]